MFILQLLCMDILSIEYVRNKFFILQDLHIAHPNLCKKTYEFQSGLQFVRKKHVYMSIMLEKRHLRYLAAVKISQNN